MNTFFSRLITVVACFFIFSAAWFCLWSISLHLVERPELAALLFPFGLRLGLMLQCPRGYWPVLLGAEWLLVYWLAQEVALAHLPLLMIGSVLTLLPVALTSRYRHQRDWRTLLLQGATSPISAVIHAILVILALLVLAPLLSWLPLSAMAALLLMVAWNMSEAHKVVDLLRHAPKDDIIVMLLCMSLTVLFDMVIAISVGIVLASLLFMRRIARMTRLAPVNVDVPDDVLVLRVIGPLFFAAAEGLFTDLESRIKGKRIVVLKWDAVPVLDAGGLDAFQRFVKRLPEGCELRISNLEFQPLRTMARAGIKPIPGRLTFFPNRTEALADLLS